MQKPGAAPGFCFCSLVLLYGACQEGDAFGAVVVRVCEGLSSLQVSRAHCPRGETRRQDQGTGYPAVISLRAKHLSWQARRVETIEMRAKRGLTS